MKFLEKITPQQRNIAIIGIAVGIIIAIGVGFYFYFYGPKIKEINTKKEELALKKKELESMEILATELAVAQQNKQRLLQELNKLERGLKPEEYVPVLLTEIEKLAQETKTKIDSIVPQEISSPAPIVDTGASSQIQVEYKEMMLTIPLQCTYESLKDFLDRLAKLPIIIVVNNLQLVAGGQKDPFFGTPMMQISLPTTIYILPRSTETNEEQKTAS